MSRKKWTIKEDNILKNNYLLSIKALCYILPDRTFSSIKNRIFNLGLGKNEEWINDEIQKLISLCNNSKTYEEISEFFPNRTLNAIKTQCSKLNLCNLVITKFQKWTEKDIKILKQCNGKTINEIYEIFNHKIKETAIIYKCKQLNIKTIDKNLWTKEEINILKKYCNDGLDKLLIMLPNRTSDGIFQICQRLNIKIKRFHLWTKEETDLLFKNCNGQQINTIDELHKLFPQYSRKQVLKKCQIENLMQYIIGTNIHIGCDNKTKLDSYQEKILFDYIYTNFKKINIKAIGLNRNNKFYNEKYNENYIPDFLISKYNKNKLIKPIIIEYYGMYSENPSNQLFKDYKEKTQRKNEYYKSNPDIYFIDLYPTDIKNNFEGVREKLISFFMSNFNINLKEASNI